MTAAVRPAPLPWAWSAHPLPPHDITLYAADGQTIARWDGALLDELKSRKRVEEDFARIVKVVNDEGRLRGRDFAAPSPPRWSVIVPPDQRRLCDEPLHIEVGAFLCDKTKGHEGQHRITNRPACGRQLVGPSGFIEQICLLPKAHSGKHSHRPDRTVEAAQ